MMRRILRRRTVLVKFVGDEDVIENITSVTGDTPSKKKRNIFYDHLTADDVENILDEDSNDEVYQPSSALSADDTEEVTDDFANKLKLQAGPSQLSNLSESSPKSTPKKKKNSSVNVVGVSGKSSAKKKKTVEQEDKTIIPYKSARLRAKQIIQEAMIDSDPEDSNEDSWDDESDGSCEDSRMATEEDHGTRKKIEKTMQTFSENYFRGQKSSKRVTSNRTMTKVELPKTSNEDLQKILRNQPEYHKDQRAVLYNSYSKIFEKWNCQLNEGFSILLHGIGSKYEVLRNFCKEMLEDKLYIEVNGFYPSLNIKKLLNTITEDIIDHSGTFSSTLEHVDFIKNHYQTEQDHFYIVVHNIDGVALRGTKSQSALSSLASSPKIHFIASVDHLNCSLIWDQIMLNHFRWLWYDVTTYEPYILETSYENSILREHSSQLVLSSLLHVFESLTPNSRGVFLILARYQLQKKGNPGMTFQEWYQECREAFLVNSEPTMDAQVSEFRSHKLLASKRMHDGVEFWYIPVAANTLTEFLEKIEN